MSGPALGKFWFRLLVVASLARGGWLATNCEALRRDPDSYRQLARNLVSDGTFGYRISGDGDHKEGADTRSRLQPTAYRPPLYPLTLAAVGWADDVGPIGVAVLHGALGVATVLLVYRLSHDWGLGRWGLLAAMLVACDPILLNQSSLVMTETLAALLAALSLLCLTRLTATAADENPELSPSERPRRSTSTAFALLSGAVVALASLCRPTFIPWGAAIVVAMIFLPEQPRHRRPSAESAYGVCGLLANRLRLAGSFLLAGGIVLAPWAVRNVKVFDRCILTTTHGGYTLWLGNNAEFYRFLDQARWGDVWDSRNLDEQYLRIRQQLGEDELRADRWAYDQAAATIKAERRTFLRACLFRVGSLWGVLPHPLESTESAARRLARYAVAVWYAAVLMLAGAGIWALGRQLCRPPWLWGLLLCLSFTAMHAVYWSNLRMRAPLMPVICLAAASGARWILSRRPRHDRVENDAFVELV